MQDDTIQTSFSCADPTRVIDHLLDIKQLRNDAELSRLLGVAPPTISKIRSGKSSISAAVVLRIHEAFGMPVADLRALMTAARDA